MSKYLNHQEAIEAFNNGEVLKVSSTILVMSKQKIKMHNSSYIVDNRMPTVTHSHYEIVPISEYEFL